MKQRKLESTNATPWQKYQDDLTEPEFIEDQAQAMAVKKLDDLYHRLVKRHTATKSIIGKLRSFISTAQPEQGLYFWGGVGRGKTYLVDTFFDCLPFAEKKRLHFHRFMHGVHKRLEANKGTSNPLEKIATDIADETLIICFDEFFVSDITDAMILAGLFDSLFKKGVSLVATSNIPPERLYWNGLQRERFLPAIALIEKYCQVVNVDGGVDYRLRTLEQADIYHYPLDEAAQENLRFSFENMATEVKCDGSQLRIEGRFIDTVKLAEGIVWFTFDAICNTPRSHSDFIELSRCFHTVLIDQLYPLNDDKNDAMRRFISLVDEFYERNVKLIIAAEVAMEKIYSGTRLAFEFKRTLSRLQEMQSTEYLAEPHIP